MTSFLEKLTRRIREKETFLCVGIDPSLSCTDIRGLSQEELNTVLESLHTNFTDLIQQTSPFVCCFKPNVAFFEQYGPMGMEVLQRVCKEIPPDIPIILDAKRSAIGDAAEAYATAFFSAYNGDCITLDPYLGKDALLPYLKRKGKGAFVVCRSSNPCSDDVQGFRVSEGGGSELFMHVANMCDETRRELEPRLSEEGGLVGLVVGATYPEDMARIRQLFPELWFLAPGVGAQGGDLEASVKAGMRADGLGLVVNVGRAIAGASDPAKAAEEYRDRMRELRRKQMRSVN